MPVKTVVGRVYKAARTDYLEIHVCRLGEGWSFDDFGSGGTAMFKFDFDIDGAHDLEEIFPTSKLQPLPSDKPSLELEPFAEIHIDHLVCVNPFKSSTGD